MERSRERTEAPVYAKKGWDEWTSREGMRERERDVRALGAPSAPYEELDCLQITKMAG